MFQGSAASHAPLLGLLLTCLLLLICLVLCLILAICTTLEWLPQWLLATAALTVLLQYRFLLQVTAALYARSSHRPTIWLTLALAHSCAISGDRICLHRFCTRYLQVSMW